MTRLIKLTDQNELHRIHDFLIQNPMSLFYQSPVYLQLLNSYLQNTETELWVCEDDHGDIIGYFPVMYKINPAMGNVCNSLPYYGSNGGILTHPKLERTKKETTWKCLLDAVTASARARRCVAVTFITNPLEPEFNTWLSSNFEHQLIDQRIGQLTPLPARSEQIEEELLGRFEDPRPRNIRKAIKEQVQVTWTNDAADYEFLFQVHRDNISAIGGLAKEKTFFNKVEEIVPEANRRLYIARKDGERIGALLLFYYNRTVEYFTPAVVEQFRNLQPTSLLIYQAMCDATRMKYEWWNWGGTWLSQGGVFDFKKKWGTENCNYYYYTQIHDNSILQRSKEELLTEYPFFFTVPFHKLANTI